MELCFADVPKILPLPQPEGRFHLLWQALDSDVIQFGNGNEIWSIFKVASTGELLYVLIFRCMFSSKGCYLWCWLLFVAGPVCREVVLDSIQQKFGSSARLCKVELWAP